MKRVAFRGELIAWQILLTTSEVAMQLKNEGSQRVGLRGESWAWHTLLATS